MPPTSPPKPATVPPSVAEQVKVALAEHMDLLVQPPLLSFPDVDIAAASEAATQPKLEKSKDTKLVRPNGEIYLVRKLKLGDVDTTDADFVRTAYAQGMPLFLYGPPGTGKTALLEAALPNLLTLPGTGQTEASDFIGDWVQMPDGTYRWIDGPLPIAAENGWPLLVDEIALIDSRELAVVYSLMDGRDELVVTANPARETVKAKPGFVVFGATNPDVPGAVLSDALLSRFKIHVYVGTDWLLAKQLGVGSKIITVARNLEAKWKSNEVVAAPQLREVLTFRDTAKVFGEPVAIRNFLSSARVEDRPVYQKALESTYGHARVEPLSF
jgi:nitric oxide reductase NorQ protein